MKKINALIGQGFSRPQTSQKESFLFAGPLSLRFSSVKVTASRESKPYAEVTVSMTSEDSAGYANLNSPKLASAKYHQHHSPMPEVTVTSGNAINGLASAHMVGGCADNLLNIKPESAFVQTTGKEKGPEVNPALLSTSTISCTGESNELHHNSYLQATGNLSYSRYQHLKKTGAGFGIPNTRADISRYKRFFYVRNSQRCAPIMVGRSGGALALAGFSSTGIPTPLRLATPFGIGERGLKQPTREATAVVATAVVATAQTRPEFIDTYWIIPEYETTHYGKVSLTRQDRRTFIAMFKDSRLIWAGRQPVKDLTEDVICTQLQKVDVKSSANPTSSVKGTGSRSQFNQSLGLLVRKIPHEGIEEISIPQGMVKITPPSTITEIVTVQEVAHV